jgi:ABC-type amino acid transport substrate-binding protein
VIVAVLILTVLWSNVAYARSPLSLGIPGNVPFTGLEDTRVTGVIAEATVLALQTLGYQVKPRALPFKRMYHGVHTGDLDVAVSVLRTPGRATLAYYSMPIVTEYTLVMVPKGRVFPLTHPADLQGKRIGGQLGFTYPQLGNLGEHLIYEKDYETNLRKIATTKLDGALIGSITGPFLAKRLGLLEAIDVLPTAIGMVPLGAAFSKMAFTESELTAFDAAIQHIQASPVWQQILSANGVVDLVKDWPVIVP